MLSLLLSALLQEAPDFGRDVLPILRSRCFECHGPEKQKGGLRLDTRADALHGGDSSDNVIVPGQSARSDLLRRASSTDRSEWMPPKGERLPEAELAVLRRWIDSGALWPAAGPSASRERTITAEDRAWWALRPIAKPAAADIDRLLLETLELEGLCFAPPATRAELIRRVSFDLTGLPPSPAEVDAFVADGAPDAYGRMVDRYLASPRYGERWGQHWLDIVRFSESEGFEYDTPIGSLWKYRDYVIRSFNEDRPFDRFILEQLAGDEAEPPSHEGLIAAGFHRLGPVRRNKGNQDVASSRNEVLTDRTDVIGAAFLGITLGCVRCHDHKFDPLLQKDYYRLQAFLAGTEERDLPLVSDDEKARWEARTKEVNGRIARLKGRMKTASEAERPGLEKELETLEDELPPPLPGINTIRNLEEPTPISVLRRGDWTKKGDPVGPRVPSVLVAEGTPELPPKTPRPRTELARWIADPKNPLTPRVLANRVWQHHFGRGIVKTANDFGKNGGRPSHPELLDFLAASLLENGWRLKPLHRMILASRAYRQSSRSPLAAEGTRKDPDNRWLWRFGRRRLSAEELRDAALAVSGKLNLKAGGESVFLPVDPELVAQLYKPSQWSVTRDPAEHFRRSIYLVAKRNLRLPSMEVFDQPALGASCACRESSTHAPQALELLNGRMSNELAGHFAERLEREAGPDPAARVELAFRLATGRPPSEREKALALEFLARRPLREFALAMFNLNGFLYVE